MTIFSNMLKAALEAAEQGSGAWAVITLAGGSIAVAAVPVGLGFVAAGQYLEAGIFSVLVVGGTIALALAIEYGGDKVVKIIKQIFE